MHSLRCAVFSTSGSSGRITTQRTADGSTKLSNQRPNQFCVNLSTMKTLALFAILLLNAVASPAAPPPLPATPLWSVTIPFTTNGTVDSSSPGGDLLTDGKGGLALVLEQDKSNAVVNHRIIWIKASGRLVLDELFDNSEDIEIILVTPKRLVAVIGNSRNLMRTYY